MKKRAFVQAEVFAALQRSGVSLPKGKSRLQQGCQSSSCTSVWERRSFSCNLDCFLPQRLRLFTSGKHSRQLPIFLTEHFPLQGQSQSSEKRLKNKHLRPCSLAELNSALPFIWGRPEENISVFFSKNRSL